MVVSITINRPLLCMVRRWLCWAICLHHLLYPNYQNNFNKLNLFAHYSSSAGLGTCKLFREDFTVQKITLCRAVGWNLLQHSECFAKGLEIRYRSTGAGVQHRMQSHLKYPVLLTVSLSLFPRRCCCPSQCLSAYVTHLQRAKCILLCRFNQFRKPVTLRGCLNAS